MEKCIANITRVDERRTLCLEVLNSIAKIRTKYDKIRDELIEHEGSENALVQYLLKHEKICQKANEKLQQFEGEDATIVEDLYGHLIKQQIFQTAFVLRGVLPENRRDHVRRMADLCTVRADLGTMASDNIHAYVDGSDETREEVDKTFQGAVDHFANELFASIS